MKPSSLLTMTAACLALLSGCKKGNDDSQPPVNNTPSNVTTGRLELTITWNEFFNTKDCWYINGGLGNTLLDVTFDNYISTHSSFSSPALWVKDLDPGSYHFKVNKVYDFSGCGTPAQPTTHVTGAFTIVKGQMTQAAVTLP